MWQRVGMSPERYRAKVLQVEKEKSKHDQLKEEIRQLSKARSKKL